MPICSFCKETYEIPRGLTYIMKDGTVFYFCSKKCQRNHQLKRDPKKTNWVKKTKKSKKAEEVKA